jgi:cytochrome c oxidase assembly protein subunit 11
MSVAARNQALLKKLLTIVVIMAGFGFALVPFYRKICQVTGINNSRVVNTANVANTQVDAARTITVEFVATSNRNLPWRFEPLTRTLQLHPGEIGRVVYRVSNTTDRPMVGQAVPSYGPVSAGKYFNKLECFCFRRQALQAHETREMPVVFTVSADLPRDAGILTLSYTFFDVTNEAANHG